MKRCHSEPEAKNPKSSTGSFGGLVQTRAGLRMTRRLADKRGISVIGTVFTLLILGVLGASLVSIVATDQESRMSVLRREKVFYAIQAGLEYVLREIKEGGYPIVTHKALGDATFTSSIRESDRRITVEGESTDYTRTHSITTTLLGKDCLTVNIGGAVIGGSGSTELQNVVLTKTCLNAVNVDSLTATISSDLGERVRSVNINGAQVFNDLMGVGSGQPIDIADTRIAASATINSMTFSSSIAGKRITVVAHMTDSSSASSGERRF